MPCPPPGTTPLSFLRSHLLLRGPASPTWCRASSRTTTRWRTASPPILASLFEFIGSAGVSAGICAAGSLREHMRLGARGAAPVIGDLIACTGPDHEPLVKGGYYHAGQVSSHRRILRAPASGAFVERFAARVRTLRCRLSSSCLIPSRPLINPREQSCRGPGSTRRLCWSARDWRAAGPILTLIPPSCSTAAAMQRYPNSTCFGRRDVPCTDSRIRQGDRTRQCPSFRFSGHGVFPPTSVRHGAAHRLMHDRPDQR